NWIGSIPRKMSFAHHLEKLSRAWSWFEHLYERARLRSALDVDYLAASGHQRFLGSPHTGVCACLARCRHIIDENTDMVQSFTVHLARTRENRRRAVVLLDKLDLHVAPVTEHHREVDFSRLTSIAGLLQLHMLDRKERTGSDGRSPELQCCF